jgi:hypothetical protein
LYVWYTDPNTSQWVIAGSGGPVGSTTTPLADGVAAIGSSATYARADHVHPVTYLNDNKIINGDMRIDQRNAGASIPAVNNAFAADRWKYTSTQSLASTVLQRLSGNASAIALGFNYILYFRAGGSAYTLLTTDYFALQQAIEADMVGDLGFGSAGAQATTLSFCAYSWYAGQYGGSLRNYALNRSYPFLFTLPANTLTKVVIPIPGDTAGTWVSAGSAGSMVLSFDLGSGANFRAPTGSWVSGNFVGGNGGRQIAGAPGVEFMITGVKLETGSVATAFNRQSLAKSMADCQRYYWQNANIAVNGWQGAGGVVYGVIKLPITMRAAPTIAYSGMTYVNASAIATNAVDADLFRPQITVTAAGSGLAYGSVTASAEL